MAAHPDGFTDMFATPAPVLTGAQGAPYRRRYRWGIYVPVSLSSVPSFCRTRHAASTADRSPRVAEI